MDLFTYAQWRARGGSRRALLRALECGLVWRVLKSVYGVEYDGEEWHDEDDQRQRDERRRVTMRREDDWVIEVVRKGELWGQRAALVASTARRLQSAGWSPSDPTVLEQIARAVKQTCNLGGKGAP